MRFEAKKELAFIAFLLVPVGIGFLAALWWVFANANWLSALAFLLTLGLLYAIYYYWSNTYYEIKKERLFYYTIAFKGSIPIRKINRIEVSEFPTTGVRPALAFKGLLIHHGAGNKLFIAPKNVDALVQALKKINRKIRVAEVV